MEAVDAVVEEEKEVVISASSSDDPSKGLPPPRRRLGFISGIHRLPLPNLETTWPSLLSHHLSRMVARGPPSITRNIFDSAQKYLTKRREEGMWWRDRRGRPSASHYSIRRAERTYRLF